MAQVLLYVWFMTILRSVNESDHSDQFDVRLMGYISLILTSVNESDQSDQSLVCA